VAQASPSGLAWVTNLPKTAPEPGEPLRSRWIHARHVDFLDEILVNLYAGVYLSEGYIGVIVEEPPRHGKSELCSHYNPCWYLGTRPNDRVILVSYEATFAATWGRKVRDTMNEWGPDIFGTRVSQKSSAADRWDIEGHKGGMYTAGALGGITGRGANVLIADDLIKNQQEAQSEVLRDRTWEEWKNTFRTRLEPNGVIFVIGTRWHEDDIIGRLRAAMGASPQGENHPLYDKDADRFLLVRLPALAEEPDEEFPEPDPLGREVGEVLFKERYPVELLRPHMANASTWASLFQQRPSPREGGLFKAEDLPIVPYPGGKWKKMVRRWDMAATDPKAGEDPDFTVGILIGEHEDGLVYVLDVVRDRKSPGEVERILKRTRDKDGRRVRIRMEQEPGSSGKTVIWNYARTIFRGYPFRGVRSTGDKILRAETLSAACERGEIRVVKARWNREFVRELTRFPNAAHDDQVDAAAGGYEDLVKRSGKVVSW
jgi:predicted phage terminase large subunit-like protein